ncbi:MAG TPA: biosynthetic arginine decarboxylase [Planctomycetota bacterium]|nr:biosynthetic arginine decarboxylase [Planctomycetota bacterium]
MTPWTHVDGEALYNVPNWGRGYFRINAEGNVEATPEGPDRPNSPAIDVYQLLGQILRRGIQTPVLLRFDGILRARVRELNQAFNAARAEFDYKGAYRGVYPIKVNQQRHVVEALLEEGRKHGTGLEVGSKPELLAAIALQADGGSLLLCNGYKDENYIETALLASKLGIYPVIVVEKFSELATVLMVSERLGIKPAIGVRSKLGGRGSGRWSDSAGDRSKFGLNTRQIVDLVEVLKTEGKLDCLELLHFHIGSQVTDIRAVKNALREATRTLIDLHAMGARIKFMDVGGGLGVDYDGSSTNFESSMNYSLAEYARDVVYHLSVACREAEIAEPAIVTESGRALTAHHAVLVTEVLGVTDFGHGGLPDPIKPDDHELIQNSASICDTISAKNFRESYHDALQVRDEAMVLFNVGQLTLKERARVEENFWRTCQKILRVIRALPYVPDDLANLERDMADTYFLNFSLFQSLPDSWAINQLFPVLPLHRLNEQPTRHAVLADITCDSDGKIDRFIDLRDVKRTLELHALRPNEPYYLGFFLVGAYQEILGDMHNLFGDPNIVHVDLDEQGRARVSHVVRGDRTEEVLSYVEYFEQDVLTRLRRHIERSLEEGRMTFEESALLQRRYEAGLASYTYLTRDRDDADLAMTPELTTNGHGPAPGTPGNGGGGNPPPHHPPPATPSSPAAQHGGAAVRGARRP